MLRRGRRQGGDDPGERTELDEVPLALLGDGGDLEDLAARHRLLGRAHAVALAAEGNAGGGIGARGLERIRAGGELVGIVEGGHQGAAHKEGGGKAGEDGAAEPADADGAADRLFLLATHEERRLGAEVDRPASRSHGQAGSPPHVSPFSPIGALRQQGWRSDP